MSVKLRRRIGAEVEWPSGRGDRYSVARISSIAARVPSLEQEQLIGSSLSTLGGSGGGKERTTNGLEAFRVISFHSVLMLW